MIIETNVVEGRLMAMKYIFSFIVVSALIPYKTVPWAPYAVTGVYALAMATVVYCFFTWLIARLVNADKIAVSVGVIPMAFIYNFRKIDIMWGIVPLPDVAIPASVIAKPFKCWCITTIPTILMILLGCALEPYRNHLFAVSPDVLTAFSCPTYSVIALFAISCFVIAFISQILFFEKWKRCYPHLKFYYNCLEIAFAVVGCIGCNKYGSAILQFIVATQS